MTLYDAQGNPTISGISLATRKGTAIPNEQPPQRHPSSMRAAEAWALGVGDSIQTRSLRSTYNCVGMVFANRRTWVEPEHLQVILEEDNYRKLADINELQRGDVVVYHDEDGDISHVGIVIAIGLWQSDETRDVFVLSQWGRDGEYFHLVNDVPYYLGQADEYWTDRQ